MLNLTLCTHSRYLIFFRRVSYKKQELLTLREPLSSSPVFVRPVLLIVLVFYVVFCLRLVSSVPNVSSFSALSIALRFSLTFI